MLCVKVSLKKHNHNERYRVQFIIGSYFILPGTRRICMRGLRPYIWCQASLKSLLVRWAVGKKLELPQMHWNP